MNWFDLSDGQKVDAVRAMCAVTGCAPTKGKTERQMRPSDRNRYIVEEGAPVDGEKRYALTGGKRNGVRRVVQQ